MIHKPLTSVGPDDLTALVHGGVREGRTLEFKVELPGASDSERKEFLADVSAIANSAGGDIVFGIEDARDDAGRATGVAGRVVGLADFNLDKETLRLTQMLRAGVAPIIPGVELREVGRFERGPVLILRIPRSWVGPHMVMFQDRRQFWGRSTSGKHLLDVEELRAAFSSIDQVPRRLQAFRAERVARLDAGNGPVFMDDPSMIVLHAASLAAFEARHVIDVRQAPDLNLRPMGANAWDRRYNADGHLVFAARDGRPSRSYVQVFRSGVIEAAWQRLVREHEGRRLIASIAYEKDLIEMTHHALRALAKLGEAAPYVIAASLVGVEGATMAVDSFRYHDEEHPIDRHVLYLPEVQLDEIPDDLPAVMRPMFDFAWQASGWPASLNYNDKGVWVGMRP